MKAAIYTRVSTEDQNLERQLDALIESGVKKENIFMEKISSSKKDRKALKDILSYAREGDVIVVLDLTRFSRSIKEFISISEMSGFSGMPDILMYLNAW